MPRKYHRTCIECPATFSTNITKKVYCSSKCFHRRQRRQFKELHGISLIKARREGFREQGLCGCGRLPLPKRKLCQKCANQATRSQQNRKLLIVKAYGGVCVCCGEDCPRLLTIDHVNNDGSAHRRELGGTSSNRLYALLVRDNFPKDRFQLLCYSCNIGRYRNGGRCPHEDVRLRLVA